MRILILIVLLSEISRTSAGTRPQSGKDSSTGSPNSDFVNFLSQNRLRINNGNSKIDSSPSNGQFLNNLRFGSSASMMDADRRLEKSSPPIEGRVIAVNPQSVFLARASTISCENGFISVAVNKSALDMMADDVVEKQLTFRDSDDDTCRATSKASNRTHFVLATLTSLCRTNTFVDRLENGRQVQIVENQVLFRPTNWKNTSTQPDQTAPPSHMMINVTCTKYLDRNSLSAPISGRNGAEQQAETKSRNPSMAVVSNPSSELSPPLLRVEDSSTTSSNHSFRLTISERAWSGPDAESSVVKFPHPVAIGSRLYAQIQLVQPSTDDDLKAFAKECYFTRGSDPTGDQKWKILTSGCPAFKNSVTLHHPTDSPTNRYTRLSFVLERIYFDSSFLFFHCKMVACSLRGEREDEGYETCPNSSVCSDRTVDSRYVPMESAYNYVSTGPIRPIKPDLTEGSGAGATCPPCPVVETPSSSPAGSQQQRAAAAAASPTEVVTVNGVSVTVVILIGIASFIVGFMFMGGLWWVHEKTEPKKFLNVKRRNSDRDSSSFLSTPYPNVCTPMTKNGFIKNGGTDTVHQNGHTNVC